MEYEGRDLEVMSFAKNYHQWILDEFSDYAKGDVVEVGAGIGDFTKLISGLNVNNILALEPSKNMYANLEKNIKNIKNITTSNSYLVAKESYLDKFDTVFYVNVLEHIENDLHELNTIHQVLNEQGCLCIFVPAMPFLYSNLDREIGHFRRYNKSQLVALLRQANFEVVKVNYFDVMGVLPWYVFMVLLKKKLSPSSVALYDKLVIPIMRKIEKICSPLIGKNLLLVAKKIS